MTDKALPTPLDLLAHRLDETTKALKSFMQDTADKLGTISGRLDQTTRATVGEAQIRRTAMEHALKVHCNGPTKSVLNAAAEIENYLTYGSPAPIPGPLLPPDLVEQAIKVPAGTLYAVQLILAERCRQAAKGYNAAHDDGHTDGRMAFEAAAAIMPVGSSLLHPLTGPDFSSPACKPWIDASKSRPRADVLVEGIALALAELERVHRAGKAYNDREATAESISLDRRAAAEGRPPLNRPEPNAVTASYVPVDPRKDTMLDTWQPAKQYHAPLGEAVGKRADTIITDGLDGEAVN